MASENKAAQPVFTNTIPQTPAPLQQEDDERGIDPMELLSVLLSKAAWIIGAVLLGAVIAYLYTANLVTPMYRSTGKLHVMNTTNSIVNMSDLQIGASLTKDYEEVIYTWEVLQQTIDNLSLSYNTGSLRGMITINNPANTRILEITVQSADPVEASMIANELMSVVNDYITKVMEAVKPNVLSKALTPTLPFSPSKSRNTIIGAVLGGFISVLVIFIMFMVDDKIKSPEDILKYTGLPTLAIVPRSEDETQTSRGGESITPFSRKQRKKLAKKKPSGETLPVK